MYSGQNYEFLFDIPNDEMDERAFEALRHKDVLKYRARTITSGPIVELEVFPVWRTQAEATRAKKFTTREAQKKQNEKNSRKKLTRLINTNFTEKDLCITLTYKGEVPDEKQAQRDIQNYIRRVKAYRARHGLGEMKYIYVIEYENGEGKRKKRVHHHIVMSEIDRDIAESLWKSGYANTRRLQPDEYGFEALARYMVKDPKGKKRWSGSKNLKEPKITTADTKFTRRMAERMAEDFETDAGPILAKLFPACIVNDCTVKYSDFVAGAYIYAKMQKAPERKRGKPGAQYENGFTKLQI